MNFYSKHIGKFSINVLDVFFYSQKIALQVAHAGKTQFDFPFWAARVYNEDAFPQVVVDAVSCCSHSSKLAEAFIYPGHLLSFI